MRKYPTQELVKSLLSYNKSTGIFTWKKRPRDMFNCNRSHKRWNNRYNGAVAGSDTTCGYSKISVDNCRYKTHSIVFIHVHGYAPKNIDHINHNGRDNRIANLREVTHQENHKNQKKGKNNTSGVTGVIFRRDTRKWAAQIMIDGKHKSLGSFVDKEDAIKARKQANIDYGFHKNHGKDRG